MTDKYITEFTEETSPASTSAILIDEGAGAYKYATIANIRTVATPLSATTGTFSGNVTFPESTASWTAGSMLSDALVGGFDGNRPFLRFYYAGTYEGQIIMGGGDASFYVKSGRALNLYGGGAVGLTINSDQSATFAGGISATTGTFSDNLKLLNTKGIQIKDNTGGYQTVLLYEANNNLTVRSQATSGSVFFGLGNASNTTGKVYIQSKGLVAQTIDGINTTFAGGISATTGDFSSTVSVGAYTLPATDGTNGQVLVTNGSGVLTWTTL